MEEEKPVNSSADSVDKSADQPEAQDIPVEEDAHAAAAPETVEAPNVPTVDLEDPAATTAKATADSDGTREALDQEEAQPSVEDPLEEDSHISLRGEPEFDSHTEPSFHEEPTQEERSETDGHEDKEDREDGSSSPAVADAQHDDNNPEEPILESESNDGHEASELEGPSDDTETQDGTELSSRRGSGASDLQRRHSVRTEALIQAAARAVVSMREHKEEETAQEEQDSADDSVLSSVDETEDQDETIHGDVDQDGPSRPESSASRSIHSSEGDGAENSSHNSTEDDVFSDRSPRTSIHSSDEHYDGDSVEAMTEKGDQSPYSKKSPPVPFSNEGVKNLRIAWRQLQDRVGDTEMERGILLPHPQNDYEVLEERLLEALELPLRRRARILECGHYLGPSNEMTPISDIDDDSEDTSDAEDAEASGKKEKKHWCKTCRGDIKYEELGSERVFRIKVYASNGLMSPGAWEACWKEMERVDIEVEPITGSPVQQELAKLGAAFDQEHQQRLDQHTEEQERLQLEEEQRLQMEEERRQQLDEERQQLEAQRQQFEEDRRRSLEESQKKLEEERRQAEKDQRERIEEERRQQFEEERQLLDAQRREFEQQRQELDNQRKMIEQEQRQHLEEARRQELEVEHRLLDEQRQQLEEARQQFEVERRQRLEEEELRRLQREEEEQKQLS
ncbi:putative pathway-specific nitrogen regulator [Diaporthe ampelina]|uniref:Putative pathway-specific nitrogen regulator n=1 Tax=Diaporthe ampelina TaxID=1214573 RepID=A0A0G2FLG1_9PEZI|nr:putative pathway-specific nitrogen regulator [Diaporthe ampelina]